MLQPSENSAQKSQYFSGSNHGSVNTVSAPLEQATIGRSLVIKGEISGAESLYIDGRIEGSINVADHRVTIGRNGVITANINAREVVIMGKVKGNVQCTDRIDIRAEGTLTGDVTTQRISVEDGAIVKGAIEVRVAEQKNQKSKNEGKNSSAEESKTSASEQPKAMAAVAGSN